MRTITMEHKFGGTITDVRHLVGEFWLSLITLHGGSMAKFPTWLISVVIILLWGTTFPALKLQLHYVSPFVLASWRVLPAGIALAIWALIRKHPRPSHSLWIQAAVSAILNVVLLYGGQIAASAYLNPGLTAALLYLQPVLVTLFARIWLHESLSIRKIVGVVVGILGVSLLALGSGNRISLLGIGFAVSAAIGWALGTVYLKEHNHDSPTWFVALQFLLGGVFFTFVSLITPSSPSHWTLVSVVSLLYIIFGGTAGAWMLWIVLLSRGEASRVSTYLFGVPAVATLLGVIGFRESFTIRFLMGFIAISASILLVNSKISRNDPTKNDHRLESDGLFR
ncbi:MAG: hypothetical protein C7B46_17775 [Sulfobacillus benefaciens]|uniref:EamA domain-containing protein n=1 Tax=Sulfobacillus benefaciens TaxID=453960 RepID=A0A2T2X819_9FIRM|nr:MAG: hypothetical protein C7B46_17775 [Sulfobacillus benefaciens]